MGLMEDRFNPASAIEIRVDEQVRPVRGQPWQEVDGISELFAPTGDPLAFTAARDVSS